ncbi:MAG: hypothetical protein EOO26_05910 [Comamonadaceae bacterium]|nr:MAG: hypothetical protein EOO26_05910 [Comamonadaceae bacterium]
MKLRRMASVAVGASVLAFAGAASAARTPAVVPTGASGGLGATTVAFEVPSVRTRADDFLQVLQPLGNRAAETQSSTVASMALSCDDDQAWYWFSGIEIMTCIGSGQW